MWPPIAYVTLKLRMYSMYKQYSFSRGSISHATDLYRCLDKVTMFVRYPYVNIWNY